jgi:hypothetical protein
MLGSTMISVGSTVRVVRNISPVEAPLRRGRKVWTLVRYSKPHGYAVIEGHGEQWHVHPESLQVAHVISSPASPDPTREAL